LRWRAAMGGTPACSRRYRVSNSSSSDDWGLAPLIGEQRCDLLEIVDERHQRGATIITSQLPVEHWHEVIADPTIADAILDRLVHNAHRLELKETACAKSPPSAPSLTSPRKPESTSMPATTPAALDRNRWPRSIGTHGGVQSEPPAAIIGIPEAERLVSDIAALRDDMRVLPMVFRQDSTLTRLLDEMRAVYAQVARMGDRIRKMEETSKSPGAHNGAGPCPRRPTFVGKVGAQKVGVTDIELLAFIITPAVVLALGACQKSLVVRYFMVGTPASFMGRRTCLRSLVRADGPSRRQSRLP
jgi:hypothetical protein